MLPLVSAIMPTYNRREFISRSINCFLKQDYPYRELIVLDDGTDPVYDLVPAEWDGPIKVIYSHDVRKQTYGYKLNTLCMDAIGEFIIHWDDDDWYAPDRITRQIKPLLDNPELVLSGTSQIYYYRHRTQQAFLYSGHKEAWLGAIAYRRDEWIKHYFDVEERRGADSRWQWKINHNLKFDLADPGLIIATVHSTNHSPKTCIGTNWSKVEWDKVKHAADELERSQSKLHNSNLQST